MAETGSRDYRRVRVQALLALVCALLLLASAVSINPINRAAERAATDLGTSTAATYFVLRTFNAALSLVQEARVQGGLAVVSAGIAPLKVLEPVDDTVERMATALFIIAALSVLLSIAFNPLAGLGWAALAAYFGFRAWMDSRDDVGSAQVIEEVAWSRLPSFLLRTGVAFSLVLPVAFVVAVHFGNFLTKSAWEEHNRVLDEVSNALEKSASIDGLFSAATGTSPAPNQSAPVPSAATQEEGMFSTLKDLVGAGQEAVAGLTERAADATRTTTSAVRRYFTAASVIVSHADDLLFSIVTILAVLVFKIIVLPVVLAMVILGLVRSSGIVGGFRGIPHRSAS